jgi:hypothetical protein
MLQLILGSIAFGRGWRWRVLIPVGFRIGLAILMAGGGTDPTEASAAALIPDILIDIALGIMCVVPPPRRRPP